MNDTGPDAVDVLAERVRALTDRVARLEAHIFSSDDELVEIFGRLEQRVMAISHFLVLSKLSSMDVATLEQLIGLREHFYAQVIDEVRRDWMLMKTKSSDPNHRIAAQLVLDLLGPAPEASADAPPQPDHENEAG